MTFKFIISGYVQGVGFRWFVQKKAGDLGIRGSVRNLSDGSVEVIATGNESSLSDLEEILWKGPAFSNVQLVTKEIFNDDYNNHLDFIIDR